MFDKLGKFEIKRLLGNGAMGEVYLGVDPLIGREVAIKTILPTASAGGDAKERFAREAKAAGVLNHPNLVTIYEFGEDQGVLYIAMEFVRGHDLEELLRQRELTRSEALEVLAQVCEGLNFAHRHGIVHRDIKPSNIRVQRDGKRLHAKVMDFDVARIGNSDMTATGMVMGTVSYMAPEYIRTGKPDPRSDLFAVGVMLYECLSGRRPFSGDTTPTILYKIVNEPPEPIDPDSLQGLSPAVHTVLDRALDKDPDARYQTAEDLAKALRAAKDPTWQGEVEDATSRVAAQATAALTPSQAARAPQAPYSPTHAVPAPAAAPAAAPAPASSGGRKGLWIGLAALLLVAGGGLAVWQPWAKPAAAPAPNPAVQQAQQAQALLQIHPSSSKVVLPTSGENANKGKVLGTVVDANGKPVQVGVGAPIAIKGQNPQTLTVQPPPQKEPAVAARQPDKFAPESLEKMQPHERTNLGLVTMSEAITSVDSNPSKAIEGFRQALQADPTNAKAYAWMLVTLYQEGRYGEFGRTLEQARRNGVAPGAMLANVRFRQVVRQERLNHKVPGGLQGWGD